MKKNINVSIVEVLQDDTSAHHQTLLNNCMDPMWSVDKDFKLIISNHAFNEKVKRISGKKITTGSDVLAIGLHYLSLYERAFTGETFTELEHTDSPIDSWAEISCSPIRNGNEITGVTCYAHDVTDAKKEENRLKLLESVVVNATDAVLITETNPSDESGPKIVYVNAALLKMTGYEESEIIGRTPRILHGPKTDRDQVKYLRQCFDKLQVCEIEVINYKKNGDEFWIHMAMAPVADNDGVFTHFVAIGRDVTEQVNNIQSIKDQNVQLRNIAWVQSHGVRGPLARIKGLIILLNNQLQSSPNEETQELLHHLKVSADEMDQVIKSIVNETEEAPLV